MKPSSVLVVDDDRQILGMIEYWLAEAGYDVVACSCFDAARTYLGTHTPDALIADIRLGAFNGLHLALFSSQTHRPTALLLMSAYDDVVVRRDAAACGGRFLLKPLDREELLTQLSEALAEDGSDGETTTSTRP